MKGGGQNPLVLLLSLVLSIRQSVGACKWTKPEITEMAGNGQISNLNDTEGEKDREECKVERWKVKG